MLEHDGVLHVALAIMLIVLYFLGSKFVYAETVSRRMMITVCAHVCSCFRKFGACLGEGRRSRNKEMKGVDWNCSPCSRLQCLQYQPAWSDETRPTMPRQNWPQNERAADATLADAACPAASARLARIRRMGSRLMNGRICI